MPPAIARRRRFTSAGEKCFLAYSSMLPYQKICRARKLSCPTLWAPLCAKAGLRAINDLAAVIAQPLAEIHIFKPYRKKLLVEATELVPHCTSDREASSGRLFHLLLLRVVGVQTAISPIHSIARPELIHQQGFVNQRAQRRYAAKREAARRLALFIDQRATCGCRAGLVQAPQQRSDCARLGDGVGIQDEQDVALRLARALIHAGGKAHVLGIGDQARRVPDDELFDALDRIVAGSVVDYDDLAWLCRQRFQTGPMVPPEL